MVSRWEDEYPADQAVVLTAPQRGDIAISMVHKVFLLVMIVALVAAVWALTSGPASDAQSTDATLGPPMGANADLARTAAHNR